jgi:hypothetical protein
VEISDAWLWRERRLRYGLLRDGGPNVVVSSVPWQLQPADPSKVIAEDEPTLSRHQEGAPKGD